MKEGILINLILNFGRNQNDIKKNKKKIKEKLHREIVEEELKYLKLK